MYFKDFSVINHDFTIKSDAERQFYPIVDLTERIQFRIASADLDKMTEDYFVRDGMKPEQVAERVYGNSQYHWVILFINDIYNIYTEWPLSDAELLAFVTKKYGDGNEFAIHHYELMPYRIVVDYDFAISKGYATPRAVTNYDYEDELNHMKRLIKIVSSDYLEAFVNMFNTAMRKKNG